MRRKLATRLAVVIAAASTMSLAPPAAAHTPFCGIRWGSVAEQSLRASAAHLTDVRAGRHACFDRLVLDLDGDPAGYRVEYVPEVRADGSGRLVPLRGGARLQVIARAADNEDGEATYTPANRRELVDVSGWRTLRQVAWAGGFEGQSTVGVGVRARLPFRVFTLDGPGAGSRLVVDVAHRW